MIRTGATTATLMGLLLLFLLLISSVDANENATDDGGDVFGEHEGETEPADAVLFPSFSLTIGVITFYLLSR